MQARVEPSFLFDTLGDVGELYDGSLPQESGCSTS